MDIKEIKSQLSITQVLSYYGLKADKNSRINCPFHDDKTPSMQIYPVTNTYCCFSGNCTAGTGDVIQFIQLKEKCDKHTALVKATELANGNSGAVYIEVPKATKEPTINPSEILTTFFTYYKTGLPRTKKAVAYVQQRSLDYKKIEVAFNSGGLHVESKHHYLINDLVQAGLLKPLPANGHSVWAKDCIIFSLKNAANEITSLYGRAITETTNKHFYLTNRNGLYPNYPTAATKKLILTECIIDAASLLQVDAIKTNYEILALYGTNGLTDEHQQAILNWAVVGSLSEHESGREIILMLDNDEAGAVATVKHSQTLQALLPNIKITAVALPNKDVNETLQAHNDEIFIQLLNERKPIDFFFSIEKKNVDENENLQTVETITNAELQQQTKLNVQNSELLIYDNCELQIEILGGIKITGLDRMKVTLKINHKTKPNLPLRDSLDLYSRNQTESLVQTISDNYDTNIKQTATTISELTSELENYRLQKIEALQPKEKQKRELTPTERTQALNELKKTNLLERTNEMIGLTGITGEENNRLIAYLIYSVRKQAVPLHVMFLGSSGSGKTYLQEKISELIHEDDSIEITQITENALYYFKQEELKNKLLLIEDLDGAMAVFYPLRELQTKRRISKTVTLKDSKGNLKTITLTVEGPVCVSGCTTKEKLYEDNANRCFLLYTDQSKEQDKKINNYQTEIAAGTINKARENQYKQLFKNIQSLLQPINIINPFAKYIELPEQVFKPRRTMTLLLGFIEAITFYHQHQRVIQSGSDGTKYIETTIADIEAAFKLLEDVLFSKSDELTKATRSFFEQLKQYCSQNNSDTFYAKEIREAFRLNPGNMKRYLSELIRYGQIKANGNRYRKGSYEYTIINKGEYEALKSQIEQHLQSILTKIKSIKVSGSVVQ